MINEKRRKELKRKKRKKKTKQKQTKKKEKGKQKNRRLKEGSKCNVLIHILSPFKPLLDYHILTS